MIEHLCVNIPDQFRGSEKYTYRFGMNLKLDEQANAIAF